MKVWKKILSLAMTFALLLGLNVGLQPVASAAGSDLTVYVQQGAGGTKQLAKSYTMSDLYDISSDEGYGYEYYAGGWRVWGVKTGVKLDDILGDVGQVFGKDDLVIVTSGEDGFSYTLTYDVYTNATSFAPNLSDDDPVNLENIVNVPVMLGLDWDGGDAIASGENAQGAVDRLIRSSYNSGRLRLFLGSKTSDLYAAGISGGREATSTVAGNRSVSGVDEITIIKDAQYDYVIEYRSGEGKPYQKFYLSHGDAIPLPDDVPSSSGGSSTGSGEIFDYWYYVDGGNEVPYSGGLTATGDMIIYPKYKAGSGSSGTGTETGSGNSGSGTGGNNSGIETGGNDSETGNGTGGISQEGNVTTEVLENDDGSVTTTITNRTTGEILSTTEFFWRYSDGSGFSTVSEVYTDPYGDTTRTVTETNIKADGTTGAVTTVDGSVSKIEANVSYAAAQSGETVTLPLELSSASAVSRAERVEITLPYNSGRVSVELPVKNATSGTVAMIMDGTSAQVVKNTVQTTDGIALILDRSASVVVVENSKTFTDMTGHWGEDNVGFVSSRELFQGNPDGSFAPDNTLSGGMIATVLARLDGEDTAPASGESWFDPGMDWAADAGLTVDFGGDDEVSRERVVTMLWQMADAPASDFSLSDFGDTGAISSATAWSWAVENGIINGMGGNLNPNGNITRVQFAAMVQRYCNYFVV